MKGNNHPAIRFRGFQDEWEQHKVSDVAPLQRGFDLPMAEMKPGKYPVVMSNGIGGYHSEYKTKGPGVITGRSGTIGKIHYVAEDYWPHNTSLWVTDFKNNYPKFVYHLYDWLDLSRFGTGSGVPTLNRNDVHDTKVAIPKFDEQKKIADYLDGIDKLITFNQRKSDNLQKVKKYMLQNMFPKKDEKSPEIRFAGFSGDWEQRKLGDLVIIGDIDHKMPETVENGIPYLMTGDFCGINELNFDGVKTISEEDYEQLSRKIKPEKGDILFARYASVGAVRYVDFTDRFLISYSCAIIKGGATINSKYLYHYLTSDVAQKQIGVEIKTGSQANIGIDSMKNNIFVTMPSADEQKKIADYLDNLDTLITLHQRKSDHLKEVKKYMLQKMFPGKNN